MGMDECPKTKDRRQRREIWMEDAAAHSGCADDRGVSWGVCVRNKMGIRNSVRTVDHVGQLHDAAGCSSIVCGRLCNAGGRNGDGGVRNSSNRSIGSHVQEEMKIRSSDALQFVSAVIKIYLQKRRDFKKYTLGNAD